VTEEPPPLERVTYDPSFVGRGIAWPMQIDPSGSIRLFDATEDIESAMRIILMTAPGERVMRPEFGCTIWELLFEPITSTLLGQIDRAVDEALAQWEPRIVVENVHSVPEAELGLVRVYIEYTVRMTNDRRNLVFPFYVIPHDGE
jgi:phage baseplate assembly protein W